MSAGRREFIGLNANGQHLKPASDIHCVNGGVFGGKRRQRNWKTIFLFSVIVAQTICMVIGFILLAYIVENKFRNTVQELHTYRFLMNEKILLLNSEIEALKKNYTMRAAPPPSPRVMPQLQGTETEKFNFVAVETFDEYPEIEKAEDEVLEGDDSSEDYEDDVFTSNASNSSDLPNLDSNKSLLPQQESRYRQDLRQKGLEKQQQLSGMSGLPPTPLKNRLPLGLESANSDHNEPNDEDPSLPVDKEPSYRRKTRKDSEILKKNTNREDDRVNQNPRIRSGRLKRHVKPAQDSGQPQMNSIYPTPLSLSLERGKETSQSSYNVWPWPAVHFDSHDLPSSRTDDCPKEVQVNSRKWKAPEQSGSEHFDLKNYENITVKKEGLYFVYSQLYFYRDRSIFGYLIKKANQSVLQCSIHVPVNRPSNGGGTTCFTAGLVYLTTNDVLKLELLDESGKCVRWGPGKSFIGLFKLPQDVSTFR